MTTIETPLKYTKIDEYIIPPHGFCPGCGVALAIRYIYKALGDKVIMVSPPGCTAPSVTHSLIHDGKPIDQISSPFGNTAMFAGGIRSALDAQGDTETLVFTWSGDGATFDIGFGAVSASAERNDDILYICNDNEAYQNTGNQRSSASPWMTINTTNPAGFPKMEFKKDIMTILAAHRIPYAATATVGFPDDLMRKAQKAKSIKGFRFLHLLNPCPSGWGYPSEKTLELSRLAVETKVFPLFEVENGVNYTINKQPKGLPISEYAKPQRRFREYSEQDLLEFEREIERRWRRLLFLANYKE